MRRNLGVTLTALGAFLLVVGLLFRFYLPGQILKDPLNYYSVLTLSGQNATCLDPQFGTEVSNASAHAYLTLKGDVSAGSSATAVWNGVTGVFCAASGQQRFVVQYTSQRSAFDRRTGQLVNCCGAEIATEAGTFRPHQSGLGWAFPIGTEQQTYQVFNATLMDAVSASYDGTTTIDGVTAYKFVEHVSDQQFGTQTVPASVAGMTGTGEVTLPEYLTATYVFDVDPATGVPLQEQQTVEETLQNSGVTATVLFNGTLSYTPQTVTAVVNYANSQRSKINLVQNIVPLVGLVLGIVLMVAGILLLARSGGSGQAWSDGSEQVRPDGSARHRVHEDPLGLFAEPRPAEAGPAEVTAVDVTAAEVTVAEAGPAEVSAAEADQAEAGPAEAGPAAP
ncbi:MAG TPA: DUF3068 domain-containing protein [Trebonia sp.]